MKLLSSPPPRPQDVDAWRDVLINNGFEFQGVRFQSRPSDRENITGASIAAHAAITLGALPDDFRWHDGSEDFAWIAEDNSLIPMDAFTMFAFGQTAMKHKQSLIFIARSLKEMDPIPADYTNEIYWEQEA